MNRAKQTQGIKASFVTLGAARAVAQQLERRVLLSSVVLNTSFGLNGQVLPSEGDAVHAAFSQGGKIIAAGDDFLERYNANGSRDASFGNNGVVRFQVTPYFNLIAAAAAPGGKMVVVGRDVGRDTSTDLPQYGYAVARFNSNGQLDPTFGSGGAVFDKRGNLFDTQAAAVAVRSDGEILVAGQADGKGRDMFVDRLLSNGSNDATFGNSGRALIDFNGWFNSAYSDAANSIALRADGRIVLGGFAEGTTGRNFALVQLTQNGQLDPTFGAGGKVQTADFGSSSEIASIALEADGSIAAAGGILAHYSASGVLDKGFGSNGKALLPANSHAQQLLVESDGKLLVGTSHVSAQNGDELVQFTAAGQLDSTFGQNGITTLPNSNLPLFGKRALVAIVPGNPTNASIVAVTDFGYEIDVPVRQGYDLNADLGDAPLLFGYKANGGLSATFGSSGVVMPTLKGVAGQFLDEVALPSGKILAAGVTVDANFQQALYLARYQSNGTLDPTFGSNGQVITHIGGFNSASQIALQPDGSFTVRGMKVGFQTTPTVGIVRFTASGNVMSSFGANGVIGLPNTATHYVTQPDGKIVVLVEDFTAQHPQLRQVRRYNVGGTIDTTFGNKGLVTLPPPYINVFQASGNLAMQGNDIIVSYRGGDNLSDVVVQRIQPNGAIDATFGAGGATTVAFDEDAPGDIFIKVAADGSIVMMDTDDEPDVQFTTLTPNGTSPGGTEVANGSIAGLAIQPDGRVIFAYDTYFDSAQIPGGTPLLERLNPDGSVDKSFTLDAGLAAHVTGLSIAANGDVIVCGSESGRPVLLRYRVPAPSAPTIASGGYIAARSALVIVGTEGNDKIQITESANKAHVVANGLDLGTFNVETTTSDGFVIITVDGLDGDDQISIGGVTDNVIVFGGNGNDTIVVANSPGATLFGGNGNDSITANSGPALLEGGSGDDLLVGGTGADTFLGDDGNDLLRPGTGPTNDVFGGAGLDTVDYSRHTQGLTIKLDGLRDSGRSGEKDLIGTDIERVYGSQGSDIIFGNTGAGGTPGTKDALYGLGGSDTVYAGNGSDALYGGDGNDWLYTRNGIHDYLDGGAGFNYGHIDQNLDSSVNIQSLLA